MSFTDSEASDGSEDEPESPLPNLMEKATAGEARRRRRPATDEGFMAAARRTHPPAIDGPSRASRPDVPPRRSPLSAAHGPPDADGFHLVESRRRWRRRKPPRQSRPVPPELVGKCFNCLDEGHVRANCTNPPRCLNSASGAGHRKVVSPLVGALHRGTVVGAHRPLTTRSVQPLCPSAVLRRHSRPPLWMLLDRLVRASVALPLVPRSAELEETEAALRLALVAVVAGTRPTVTMTMVAEYLSSFLGLDDASFSVWRHAPEDFVVRFARPQDLEVVPEAPFRLIWNRWRRTSLAVAESFHYRVLVGISRVPLHARSVEVAQHILLTW